jgi:hypothetical protein
MRLWNPVWWASEGRRFYGPLLRWYEQALKKVDPDAAKPLYARLGTCYYHMGFYPKWEEYQRLVGLSPARLIEKILRWDGKSDYSGKGYETVTAHLTAQVKDKRGTHIFESKRANNSRTH